MPVRTAIMTDPTGNPVSVQCKLWENWEGVTFLSMTLKQLRKDHPEYQFDGWVYDLNDSEQVMDLRCRFLSPNVVSTKAWVYTEEGTVYKEIHRGDV